MLTSAALAGLRGGVPYAPPEVYLETLYDPIPVDIFALAVLFCEMMEPRLPWKHRPWPNWEHDSFSLFATDAVSDRDLESDDRIRPFLSYESWESDSMRFTMDSLVALLPERSRPIIRHMLEPEPNLRATWDHIWSDQWVSSLWDFC